MKSARYIAVQALNRLTQDGAYSNLVIDALVSKHALDARERTFAHAIFYTAVERLLTIDFLIARYYKKPVEKLSPQVLGILRCAFAQLVWMDGVDDYAAVSESVELARKFGQPKAAGLVNGILRSFLRDEKQIPVPDGSREKQLSVTYSCPEWLIHEWICAYGENATLGMLEKSLGKPPVYLRVNTQKISDEKLLDMLSQEGVAASAEPAAEHCIRVEGHLDVPNLRSFQQGFFHVQDLSSQLCALTLGAQPGERILDVCSAPGGKTFTIAQQMQDQGELVAQDLHEKRAALVQKGAQRLGLYCIRAQAGDGMVFCPDMGLFDRILCDVPCSGFGIIRRKPEIKYKPPMQIQNLPEIQYKILENSAQYLKREGTLVYSTCTLLMQENEQVCTLFTGNHPEFILVEQKSYTGKEIDTDGFFTAVFRKR